MVQVRLHKDSSSFEAKETTVVIEMQLLIEVFDLRNHLKWFIQIHLGPILSLRLI